MSSEEEQLCLRMGKAWRRIRGRTDTNLAGHYFDPKHGGCLRTISNASGPRYVVLGVYGHDEPPYAPGSFWSAVVETKALEGGETIPCVVRFTGKRNGEKVMLAKFHVHSKTLHFEDGNTWIPMYANAKQFAKDGVLPHQTDGLLHGRMQSRLQRKPML